MNTRFVQYVIAILLLLTACAVFAKTPTQNAGSALGGTSWQLVKIQGSDDTTVTPGDRSKYTIVFGADGTLSARIDCNRGRGTWKSSGPSQLELGPLAITRAMCPSGSLDRRIVKDWKFVRSYVMREGNLFISLMADGGIYEFEPLAGTRAAAPKSPVRFTGPITFECGQRGGGSETLNATFFGTRPPMVLLERGGQSRPAFLVRSASGSKYEGEDVMYWDAHGVAAVTWSGVELKCKRR